MDDDILSEQTRMGHAQLAPVVEHEQRLERAHLPHRGLLAVPFDAIAFAQPVAHIHATDDLARESARAQPQRQGHGHAQGGERDADDFLQQHDADVELIDSHQRHQRREHAHGDAAQGGRVLDAGAIRRAAHQPGEPAGRHQAQHQHGHGCDELGQEQHHLRDGLTGRGQPQGIGCRDGEGQQNEGERQRADEG